LRTTPKPLLTAVSATRYGRYVGRVGGLAVALGIGLAIANSSAVAIADEGSSGSDSSSSSPTPSRAASDSNDSPTERDTPTSRKTRRQAKADATGHDDRDADTDERQLPAERKSSDRRQAQALETTTRRASVRVAPVASKKSDVEHESSGATDDPAAPAPESVGRTATPTSDTATAAASPLGTDQQLEAAIAALLKLIGGGSAVP